MRVVVLILFAACSYAPHPAVTQGDDAPPIDTPPPIDTIDMPPGIDACVATTEVCNGGTDEDCNGMADCGDPACTSTAYCCAGTGLVQTISNNCNTDFGMSGSSDLVEIYCCDGQARFCLSGEACPWRAGCIVSNKTCSHSGLSGDILATATCQKWMGTTTYGCPADEQAVLTP